MDRTNLIDIAEDNLLNSIVFESLTDDTTVTSTNDQNLLGIRVTGQGDVCNHFLVAIHGKKQDR